MALDFIVGLAMAFAIGYLVVAIVFVTLKGD